ncbi:MAG: hypothetical protein ACLUD2_18810 [Clostridium sp.]
MRSDDPNLVRLDDSPRPRISCRELEDYFETPGSGNTACAWENGHENTQIIEKSEQFFRICDEATGLAEAYSQRKATALNQLEQVVFADIAGLPGSRSPWKYLRHCAMRPRNRILCRKGLSG